MPLKAVHTRPQQADLNRLARLAGLDPYPPEAYRVSAHPHRMAWLLHPPRHHHGPVGFAVLQVVLPEAELLDMAIHPAWRSRGLGERMLRRVLARTAAQGATRCCLEVRAANTPARQLYRKLGFTPIGIRRGYYQNPPDDAWVMAADLPPAWIVVFP